MQRYGSLPRLGGAVLALGVGLIVLWQMGVFSSAGDVEIADDSGRVVQLQPADVSIDTVAPAGFSVGLREGDVAPDFEFSAFDGTRMRLSDFRGRPVFLNFWATWCGPCRAELPAMEVKLREHSAAELAVLGVNTGERIEAAERFLDKLDVELTAYAYDPAADVAKRYSVPGMPTSFFIDAEGVITGVYALALSEALMEDAILEAIAGYGAAAE
ncbi:MAG TPA: TlpA disulfide reductase family protein [Dehalococcoidia bacterium]|nr:TlpA disulfide reductase family protein [Dehalococcoidia bacterium]